MRTKICKGCKERKPFTEFEENKSRRDGYNSWCKRCKKREERRNPRKKKPLIKNNMKTNLKEIQDFLVDKSICLLGNARSILNTEKDIDSFDVVCRMNRGCPSGKEIYIGSRTDILFLSTRIKGEYIDKDKIEKEFNPKYVIWMTINDSLASEWVKNNAYQNPKEDITNLKKLLNSKPSTGCLSIYFLLKYVKFKKLTIYGFDFFKTGTWYHNKLVQFWHKFEKEKILIQGMIENRPNVELIIEEKIEEI